MKHKILLSMVNDAMKQRKQTILMGALTGSAGIFITKLIGLIYVVPFHALIGVENIVYYTYAYRVYGYLLNVTMAGFPFAIASLVAKYMVKEDYDMVIAVRRISFAVMGIFGAVCMFGMILFAMPLASLITNVSQEAVQTTATVLQVISLALFVVPILGVYRGFYQGLKELNLYAASQVLEQLIRVAFLLVAGYTAVYLFRVDRIYGVYFAVLSTSVSALVAILHIKLKDVGVYREIREKEAKSFTKAKTKQVMSELLRYAMPFMVVSVLGYSYYMIDMFTFERAMVVHGVDAQQASLIFGIIGFTVDKLTSIPMVVAPGFSLAIIPYVTASYVKQDWKTLSSSIGDCLGAALFLVLPLSLVLLSLGTPIYYVLYRDSYEIGGALLSWYALDGMTSALAPVVTAILMALNLRALNIRNIMIGVVVKLITVVPLVVWLGYPGALLSSVFGTIASIVLNMHGVGQIVVIHYRKLLTLTSKIFLCLCATQFVFLLCAFVGLRVVDQVGMAAFLELAVVGILGGIAYFACAIYLNIPQTIFHKTNHELMAMVRLGGRK